MWMGLIFVYEMYVELNLVSSTGGNIGEAYLVTKHLHEMVCCGGGSEDEAVLLAIKQKHTRVKAAPRSSA